MHRIGVILGLATLLAIGSSVTSHAAEHAKPHAIQGTHAQAMSSASCTNPALCGGSCPHAATSTAKTAASVQHLNGAACPVSDPSKCPASCRRSGSASTTAVAVNTRH
jgi:hypothetical protein